MKKSLILLFSLLSLMLVSCGGNSKNGTLVIHYFDDTGTAQKSDNLEYKDGALTEDAQTKADTLGETLKKQAAGISVSGTTYYLKGAGEKTSSDNKYEKIADASYGSSDFKAISTADLLAYLTKKDGDDHKDIEGLGDVYCLYSNSLT